MKAIILCGGQGTRLREQTEVRPKPMVEIGGYPILWHIMKLYSHFGITEFILCLGYKAGLIKEYFLNYRENKSDFTIHLGQGKIDFHGDKPGEQDWKVTLAFTGENAMTGCRVKRGARYLGDDSTFCVTYGDGLADIDLAGMLKFHKHHGGLATLAGVRPPSRFGELHADGTRVVRFSEKPQVSQGAINGGFFFFERAFLDYLDDDDNCVLEREPLEHCAADRQLFVYEHAGFWQCMDTYRDWLFLQRLWDQGTAPWKVWDQA